MPEHFEGKNPANIASEKLEGIRVEFAEELEKLSSQSANWKKLLRDEKNDIAERTVEGAKAYRTLGTENLVTKIGQKFNLSEEEIGELMRQLLEEKKS